MSRRRIGQESLGFGDAVTSLANRADAAKRLGMLTETLARQSAVNRVLELGRVPLLGAKIIRALDQHGLLGNGVRVLGTNAIYVFRRGTLGLTHFR